MHYTNNEGYKVEEFVKEYFDSFIDLKTEKKGLHYDLLVTNTQNNKSRKIEIKSTNLIIKNGNDVCTYGRFYFEVLNYKPQIKDNVFVCFVIVINNSYEIIGFKNIKSLRNKFKSKKYIPFKDLINFRMTKKNKFTNWFYV